MRKRHLAPLLVFLACASSTITAIRTTAEVPFELTQNHIYLPVAVGRHEPSWFLLDTGAQMSVLAQTTADKVGLISHGSGKARGAGPGIVQTTLLNDVDLHFAGMSVHMAEIAGLPLTGVSLPEGRAMEGILGYNILNQFAIEIDYEHHVLRFHDPSTYAAPPDAVVAPITFNYGHPVVAAELTLPDGRTLPMRVMVDTGARGAILVNTAFAKKHGIYDAIEPSIEGAFGVGVGGASEQRVGRGKRFSIAGVSFDAPIVSASRDRAGATASAEVDGIVGGEILRRFTVTLDYARKRMLFAPNGALREPFETDMSGALFKGADLKFDRILVRYVLPHSPAAEAGLREGDEVVTIDGRPAPALTIHGIRELFQQPDKRYMLHVRRRGREMDVPLVTRRLV